MAGPPRGERWAVRVVLQRVQIPVSEGEPRTSTSGANCSTSSACVLPGSINARDLPALVPAINRLVGITGRRIREPRSFLGLLS